VICATETATIAATPTMNTIQVSITEATGITTAAAATTSTKTTTTTTTTTTTVPPTAG